MRVDFVQLYCKLELGHWAIGYASLKVIYIRFAAANSDTNIFFFSSDIILRAMVPDFNVSNEKFTLLKFIAGD